MKYSFHEICVGLGRMREQNVIVELLFEERVCIKSEDFCGWSTHKKCRGCGGKEGGGGKGRSKQEGKGKGQRTGGDENIHQE